MRTGLLVGAVGLALASTAQADRTHTNPPGAQAASKRAALLHDVNIRIKASAQQAASADSTAAAASPRSAAVGAPETKRRQRVLEGLRAQVAKGAVDVDEMFLDARILGLATIGQGEERDVATRLSGGVSATPRTNVGGPVGGPFDFFDGYEAVPDCYSVDPSPCDTSFDQEYDDGVNPEGNSPTASFFYSVVDWDAANKLCPQFGAAPNDPEVGGDGNDYVLLDQRGSWSERLRNDYIGWSTTLESLYVPEENNPVIVGQDFYFPEDPMIPDNLESTGDLWSPASIAEGFAAARVAQRGFDPSDPLADPDGVLRRPKVLGPRSGSFTIGTYYVPPRDPAPGLPTFETRTNEWFSVAVVIETNRLSVLVRDSQTDGTNGVLIDNPRDLPGFEIGWNEIYPGIDPVNIGQKGGAAIWTGYGRAVNKIGQPAPEHQLVAGASVDSIYTIASADPTEEQAPDYARANYAQDNQFVIGPTLATPPQPKQTIDPEYVDDIELYTAGGLLRFQGGTWFDALSSLAVIDDDSSDNTTPAPGSVGGVRPPTQSIRQRNEFDDSMMRREFETITPIGDQRPWARAGAPVDISATLKNLRDTTQRSFAVVDPTLDIATAWILGGATNPDDSVAPALHVRLPNPLFDPNEPSAPSNRVDDRPPTDGMGNFDLAALLASNPKEVNYPTISFLLGPAPANGRAILRLHGDGTAQWLIEQPLGDPLQEVVFDAAFFGISPALDDILVDRDMNGDFESFQTEMRTASQIEIWSGNNIGGFFDTINVDDISVQGPPRDPGVGPVFELPYCDDFDVNYDVGERLNGQGDTPFITDVSDSNTVVSLDKSDVLVEDTEGDLPGMAVDWCSYVVLEVFPQFDRKGNLLPDEWGIEAGDIVNARVEELFTAAPPCDADLNGDGQVGSADLALLLGDWDNVGGPADLNGGGVGSADLALLLGAWGPCPMGDPIAFVCPDPNVKDGEANLILTAPGALPGPCVVSVQFNGVVNSAGVNDPADDTFWTCFTRHQEDELFCRYEITEFEVEIDPFDNQPFEECPDWQVGDVIAMDQLFAVDPDTGLVDCPGLTSGGDVKTGRFEVLKNERVVCEGEWRLLSTSPDPDCEALPGDVAPDAEPALDTDLRGYAFDFSTKPRWRFSEDAGGGAEEDGIIRIAQEITDDVRGVSIDPGGAFGAVAAFANMGAFERRGDGLFISTIADLPTTSSSPTEDACIYWDLYLQDVNTQVGVSISGSQPGEASGSLITTIGYGGPNVAPVFNDGVNDFPVPQGNIAVRVRNPNVGLGQHPSVFIDTGVGVPVGQWFRTCLCVRDDGTFKVGINTSGLPGGPGGDDPEDFDDTLVGADPDAQLVAEGSILVGGQMIDLISIGSFPITEPANCPGGSTVLPVTDITTLTMQQNFNDEGDGFVEPPPVVWEALAEDAVAPNGVSAGDDDEYCFYRVESLNAGALPPLVIPIDPSTGDALDEAPADGAPDRRPLAPCDVLAIKWEAAGGFNVLEFDDCPEVFACQDPDERVRFEMQDGGGAFLGAGEMILLSDRKDEEGAESIEGGVSNETGPGAGTMRAYDGNRPGGAPYEPAMLMACFVQVPAQAPPELRSRWFVDNLKLRTQPN